jgi:mannitol-1-phosphate 5-dehydrogenase
MAEPYKELPVDAAGFAGLPPDIVGMLPVSPFSFYVERKLYIHNAGHAVLGYLGYRQGYHYGYEALAKPEIAAAVRGAMHEAQQALEKRYQLTTGALNGYIDDLLIRFQNRALGDTLVRLGRDPIRKLAPQDRLVGAALAALAQDLEPVYLVEGIAAALSLNPPDDPSAHQLQDRLRRDGLEAVLRDICGLEPDSRLATMIRSKVDELNLP